MTLEIAWRQTTDDGRFALQLVKDTDQGSAQSTKKAAYSAALLIQFGFREHKQNGGCPSWKAALAVEHPADGSVANENDVSGHAKKPSDQSHREQLNPDRNFCRNQQCL